MNTRNGIAILCISAGLTITAGSVISQTVPTYVLRDIATFVGPVTGKFALCWKLDTPTQGVATADWIQFRRNRFEGGQPELSNPFFLADWQPGGIPTEFCATNQVLPRTGHWVVEARTCAWQQQPAFICSEWRRSDVKEHAYIGNEQKAWWIYAFAPPPGQPVPLDFITTDPNRLIQVRRESSGEGNSQ